MYIEPYRKRVAFSAKPANEENDAELILDFRKEKTPRTKRGKPREDALRLEYMLELTARIFSAKPGNGP